MLTIEQLYNQHIKPLPAAERLRLITLIAHGLTQAIVPDVSHQRSLLELEGLGVELREGIDAQ